MKKLLTFLTGMVILFAMSVRVSAQSGYEVRGVIVDAIGPVVGASVIERGTSNGSATGPDGNFALRVSSARAVVEVSCIGYQTLTYVASELPSRITLQEDTEMIEETVVVGYGSLSKKEVSSAVVSVRAEDFNKAPSGDPMQLLVGKVAGLNIDVSANGNSSSYQIRGATSIKGSNSPLVVIDGIIGGDLADVATQDIESISVLKDGASAAIYGTRGANGVILVTTRKGAGTAGRVRVTYDSYIAVSALHKLPEVYNLEEWRKLNEEKNLNKTDYGGTIDREYWKELRNDKPNYDHNQHITLAGSTAKSNYSLSLNYTDRNQLYKNNTAQSYSARFQMSQKMLNDFVETSTVANIRANVSQGNSGSLAGTIFMNPTIPVYDKTGETGSITGYYWPTNTQSSTNAVENNRLPTNKSHSTSITFQQDVKLNLLKTDKHLLTTNANASFRYNSSYDHSYTPSVMQRMYMWSTYDSEASLSSNNGLSRSFEWLINYNFASGDHTVKAVAGYSYTDSGRESMSETNRNFQYDQFLWYNIGVGTALKDGQASMSSGKSFSKIAGVFGRATYSWKNLLTATASLRYEGSSKFGKNKKYGYFPAVSAAWTISNMPFMAGTRDWMDELRLRASYGVTGRNAGSDYESLSVYSSKGTNYLMDGDWHPGYALSKNANPNLGWETAVVYNYGIDFELFKRRLTGSLEYFDRRSEDLLYEYDAPQPPYVYDRILLNLGSTQNRGVELALNWRDNINRDLRYSIGGTYSYSDAFLRKLGDDLFNASYVDLYSSGGLGSSEWYFRLEEGTRIGTIRGFKYAGYNDEGQILHYKADGTTGTKTAQLDDDKVSIGNTLPKHSFSIYFTLNYKQWDLTVNGRGLAGMDIWNGQKQSYGYPGVTADNLLKSAYEKYPYLTADNGYINSFFLEKGDWFKIEKVSVGRNFNFKPNKFNFERLYIYVAATNLLTLTKFTGVDPSTVTSIGLTPGMAGSTVLYTTKFTLGVTANF